MGGEEGAGPSAAGVDKLRAVEVRERGGRADKGIGRATGMTREGSSAILGYQLDWTIEEDEQGNGGSAEKGVKEESGGKEMPKGNAGEEKLAAGGQEAIGEFELGTSLESGEIGTILPSGDEADEIEEESIERALKAEADEAAASE